MMTPDHRLRNRRRALFGLCYVIAAAAFLGYMLFYSGYFSVRSIDCQEDHQICSLDVTAELERHRGENTLLFNAPAAASKIKKANFLLSDVKVAVTLPQTLRVSLSTRVPFVQFVASQAPQTVWMADRDGMVLGSGERSATVPLVLVKETLAPTVGEKLPEKFVVASSIVDALGGAGDEQTPPVLESDMLEVRTREGSIVRFSLTKPPAQQLATLQLVQNQARIEGTPYREIDLQFSEPIVKK